MKNRAKRIRGETVGQQQLNRSRDGGVKKVRVDPRGKKEKGTRSEGVKEHRRNDAPNESRGHKKKKDRQGKKGAESKDFTAGEVVS